MLKIILSILIAASASFTCAAQAKHSLVVGIDRYEPTGGYPATVPWWILNIYDLHGCRNDALSIRSILISRFGFSSPDIDMLLDTNATRDAILQGLNRLLTSSRPGDIAVFYYAGHGTTVKNSLSFEADQLDEAIVPTDTWKENVTVIRDKELSRIFNSFIDKKVSLTVIFDCCHSASLSRSLSRRDRGNIRYAPRPGYDVKDAYKPAELPEKRDGNYFLAVGAAQSDEVAEEMISRDQVCQGAFTLALEQAILQQPADAAAEDIFITTRALMKGRGSAQEPGWSGQDQRRQMTLFGIDKGASMPRTAVAVEQFDGKSVLLQGGSALGLCKGSRLTKLGPDAKDSLVSVVVDTVLGISASLAHVEKGNDALLVPGCNLVISNWTSSLRPLIQLYIPEEGCSEADLIRMVNVARALKSDPHIHWLNDRRQTDADVSVFFRGPQCFIKADTAEAKLMRDVTVAGILGYCKPEATLYMELPVSRDSARILAKRMAGYKWLGIVHDPAAANYLLQGRLGDQGRPAYGWGRAQISAKDSLGSMPLLTDQFEYAAGAGKNVTDSLLATAMQLSKLLGWIDLAPPDGSRQIFAYRLEIVDQHTGKPVANDRYTIGDSIFFRLVWTHPPAAIDKPQYVYLFVVDGYGKMTPIFPRSEEGNTENKFQKFDSNGKVLFPDTIRLTETFAVSPPSGTDNYFLLTTDRPLPNTGSILSQPGVYSGAATKDLQSRDHPLINLLDMGNEGFKELPPILPSVWTLQKIFVKCTY